MWIVSRDRIFARALQITLVQAGLSKPRLTEAMPETVYVPLAVDLDDFDCPDTPHTVTFSSNPNKCADLTRPFLMSDFAELCKARFAFEITTQSLETDQPMLLLTDGGVLLNGESIPLSPGERAVLKLLLAHAGECVSKEEFNRLWKSSGNMTEVYIRHLRKKLDEPSGLRLIRTVRERGYMLCLPSTTH